MTKSILQAAQITILAVPVLLVGAAVYAAIQTGDYQMLKQMGDTSLTFLFGAMAARATWSAQV